MNLVTPINARHTQASVCRLVGKDKNKRVNQKDERRIHYNCRRHLSFDEEIVTSDEDMHDFDEKAPYEVSF